MARGIFSPLFTSTSASSCVMLVQKGMLPKPQEQFKKTLPDFDLKLFSVLFYLTCWRLALADINWKKNPPLQKLDPEDRIAAFSSPLKGQGQMHPCLVDQDPLVWEPLLCTKI